MQNNTMKVRLPWLQLSIAAALGLSSPIALAQESVNDETTQQQNADDAVIEMEVVEVIGVRQSLRTSAALKRQAPTIIDALTSEDIGQTPDLSVAETLERITGVTGDRFKGNASEISIRGMGPFLGFSTFNGRVISSGSGNRSVAFSQFPSELVNGVAVYKAQTADLLEGGVSGTIDLRTTRPVDYGKRRFIAELNAGYNPYQSKFNGDDGLGGRGTISFVDSFELASGGELGYAIGYSGSDNSVPEESYNTSSNLRNCNSDRNLDGGSNCSFSDDNAAAGGGAAENGPFYFVPNSFFFRQMESIEDRDSLIAALQWKPNDQWDVNLDLQWSNRAYFEDRHDLLWDDGRRRISDAVTNADGALLSYTGESRISSYGEYRVREEEYQGGGINVRWSPNDKFELSADVAFSDTERFQTRTYTRFRSDRLYYDWQNRGRDTWPNVSRVYTLSGGDEIEYDWINGTNGDVPITDFSFFDANSEGRNYRFDISDKIDTYRLDGLFRADSGFITDIKAGVVLSERSHVNEDEQRVSFGPNGADETAAALEQARGCLQPWPQSDFGEDGNSPVRAWATYDTRCAYDVLLGFDGPGADDLPVGPIASDIDITETVTSGYLMASFATDLGDMPVDGNLGIRYVNTDIDSVSIRNAYTVTNNGESFTVAAVEDANGDSIFERNVISNSYDNVLPSANVRFGLTDDVQLRLAYYRALSRPDMWFYGSGRAINIQDGEYASIQEALDGSVSALGNPRLEAIESDNLDLSVAWYMSEDSYVSLALYTKDFEAQFRSVNTNEDVIVNGVSYNTVVNGVPTILDDSASIDGFELTFQHAFDYLPAPWEEMGFIAAYNYASSDFETPENGSLITPEVRAMIMPANIAGLSEDTYSMQFYWENEKFSARLAYKYRSEYLKPFGENLGQTNRFVDDHSSLDLSLSYNITDALTLKFQALNLENNAYVEQRVARGAFNRIEYSGARYFLGLRYAL